MTTVVVAVGIVLSGCTAGTAPLPTPTSPRPSPTPTVPPPPDPLPFAVAAPAEPALVLDIADPVAAALAASRAVFDTAPVTVLAAADDAAAQLTAASAAVALGAPLLLVPPADAADPAAETPVDSAGVRAELDRLGTRAVLVVGPAEPPADLDAVHVPVGAGGAALEAATGRPFGAAQEVPAGGEVAAVGTLGRPDTGVLRLAPPPEQAVEPPVAPDETVTSDEGTVADEGVAGGDEASGGATTSDPLVVTDPDRATGTATMDSPTPADTDAAAEEGEPSAAAGSVPENLSTASSSRSPSQSSSQPSSSPSPDSPFLPWPTPRAATPEPTGDPALPLTEPATTAPAATVALTGVGGETVAVLATLRAAGVPLVDVPTGDPRATAGAVEALAAVAPEHVVALGAAFGPADRLAARVAAAATGVQLPGGGQLLFPQTAGLPGKRYVALYGTPGTPALGVLGEQDVPATIARAEEHAAPYRALTGDTVVPGVEIIATIASAGPGEDGNYSAERPVAELLPLVQAAGEAGMTVVLDLQPGRTDFLTQARLYEELLLLPHVSLALDPEWRLEPDQVHLRQIGHVGIDEVNGVAAWLAALVRDRHLPQKMLVLHQFMLRMVDGRERLDTSHDELAMVIHVDGQGSQGSKVGTWNAIRDGAPAVHWGWKNFYDEDTPAMLDPAATYAISPTPELVTYQ